MKKVIAIDLDGTLLNNEGSLTEETINYFHNLDKDYAIVITTGRPFRGAFPFYDLLRLDTPMIYNNGSSISNPSNPSFIESHQTIPIEEFKEMCKKTKDMTLNSLYCRGNKSYIYNRNSKLDFLLHINDESEVFEGPLDEIMDESPSGAIFVIKNGFEQEFEEIINNTKSMNARCWGNYYGLEIYEVFLKGYSKARALEYVLDYYHLTNKDLICFGDGINDGEMLRYANIGVAMKNANEDLKAIANEITAYDNNQNGVIIHLEKLIKKTL